MAGLVDIPKFIDYRDEIQRHDWLTYPVLSLEGKTTIAIHHSLTKQGLSGSNADGFARYHVETLGWPSIGYSYVIEPDGTVKFCNDIELRTYHVGDHNNYAVGIVLTGDFRYENPTDEQRQSLRNLVSALQNKYSHLKYIKGHNEFSGYAWKPCPEFDYRAVLNETGSNKRPEDLPNEYTVQEGDTFWSIAKGLSNVTVNDLEAANPEVDPTSLEVGQEINLGNAEGSAEQSSAKQSEYEGDSIIDYLNHIGRDSSFDNRKDLAEKNGISGYEGTADQNMKLLNALRDGGASNQGSPSSNDGIRYVHLPASSDSWRIYPTDASPVKGNEKGFLKPDKFDGLTYEILDEPQTDVVTIDSGDFGKGNIFVASSTGATISGSDGGSSGSSSSSSGKEGQLKIINVESAAYVMDAPDSVNSNNLGTIGKHKTLPLEGSVRGKNSDSGYWEVKYRGSLGYVTGEYGEKM